MCFDFDSFRILFLLYTGYIGNGKKIEELCEKCELELRVVIPIHCVCPICKLRHRGLSYKKA